MKALLKTSFIAFVLIALIGCKEKQTVKIDTPVQVKKEEKMTADIADQDFIWN